MKSVVVWIIGIALFSTILWFTLKKNANHCEELKLLAQSEITQSNFCETSNDCRAIKFGCPFGCETVINRNQFETVRKRVSEYNSNCMFICPDDCSEPSAPLTCVEQRCVRLH